MHINNDNNGGNGHGHGHCDDGDDETLQKSDSNITETDMSCTCRYVEEIGPITMNRPVAFTDATSPLHQMMPPQQMMTHLLVYPWLPGQHRLSRRPISRGQGCWERCLAESRMQELNGNWITS